MVEGHVGCRFSTLGFAQMVVEMDVQLCIRVYILK